MWLKFGVAPDGQLVCVEDVGSGKTKLLCPIPYQTVEIQILGTWTHRGNVELYFKHR